MDLPHPHRIARHLVRIYFPGLASSKRKASGRFDPFQCEIYVYIYLYITWLYCTHQLVFLFPGIYVSLLESTPRKEQMSRKKGTVSCVFQVMCWAFGGVRFSEKEQKLTKNHVDFCVVFYFFFAFLLSSCSLVSGVVCVFLSWAITAPRARMAVNFTEICHFFPVKRMACSGYPNLLDWWLDDHLLFLGSSKI